MSSPMPPYAVGTAQARNPSRRRSPQLSTGFLPSRSYIAARGAIFSRVSASARSTTSCSILASHGLRGRRVLPGRLLAAAGAGHVERRRVLAGSLGVARLSIAAHDVDLRVVPTVHPVAGNTGDLRASRVDRQ